MVRLAALVTAAFLLMASDGTSGHDPYVPVLSGEDLLLTGKVLINNDVKSAILESVRGQSKLLTVENVQFRYDRDSSSSGTLRAYVGFEKASFVKAVWVEVLLLDARQDIVTSNSVYFDPTTFFKSHFLGAAGPARVGPEFRIFCGHPDSQYPPLAHISDAEVRRITQFRVRISAHPLRRQKSEDAPLKSP